MAEKLQKVDQLRIPRVDTDTLWLAEAVSAIQKERPLNNKEATQVLFGMLLSELKKIETIGKENPKGQIDKVTKLYILTKQMLRDDVEKLENLANSNKFKPLEEVSSISDKEINDEKLEYLDKTKNYTLTNSQAKDLATNKKIIKKVLKRLLTGDGVQNLAQKLSNTEALTSLEQTMAADLGKIFQAIKIIELHNKEMEKILEQEKIKRDAFISAKTQAGLITKNTIDSFKNRLELTFDRENFRNFLKATDDLVRKIEKPVIN